jgi:serine/threonine protein kinase
MTAAQPLGFLKPGALIDSFRIVKALGEGANGLVLLVKRRGRQFALKLARRREVSDDVAKVDARMMRELGCLIHLEHANIIRARAWGRFPDLIGDYCYLVLDYVDGWTLAEWLELTRPSFAQVARVFVKLTGALDYMHRRGVFHRDISLSNILIRKDDGEPLFVDFGAGDFANAPDLTDAPIPPGTNRFRAPEAVNFWRANQNDWGARYDFRATDDQYALAVCLYDALTDAETATDAERRTAPRIPVNSPLVGSPPAPRTVNPRVPEALSALVALAVEHDSAKRLPTLDALSGALEEMGAEWEAPVFARAEPGSSSRSEGDATRGRARRRRMVAASGAVVAAAAALALLREPRPPAVPAGPGTVGGPPASLFSAPPSSSAPPAIEVPSSPEAPAQKEPPTLSPPRPLQRQPAMKKSKSPSAAFTPEFLAKCAGLGLAAAAELGCPQSQVRPERDRCPPEAVDWMNKMQVDHYSLVFLVLDENQPGDNSNQGVFHDGRYTGRFDETIGGFKEGWRVEGQVWTGRGKYVVGRYTRVLPPPGATDDNGDPLPSEIPVCIILGGGEPAVGLEKEAGSKPGAAVIRRSEGVRFIKEEWTQP